MTYNELAPSAAPKKLRPLAALAVAALIGTGCLATAVQAGADPGDPGGQAAKYSACMRANGVPDFPDPNADGHIAYGGISVPKAVWVKAVGACESLAPQSWLDGAGRTPEQQQAALRFAQCMRDNGVPDFPDPATNDEPLIDTSKMRGDVSAREIPELKGAQESCHDFFTAALPGPLGTGRPG
ncbi:hypothetical protein [Mycolicibacterium sp. HK-90]|uniref:hypothetical protein n=1 Tax=Mycolicibacterium sp. HK-90 TaxID=3056937 RepID=UPI00265A53BA|nr:hypothetical protein [Mycolicibacterium sp. HK-90]WKG01699.1 hypothetical protein QU592_20875 [Mycolicibacterium sp. HK-90]